VSASVDLRRLTTRRIFFQRRPEEVLRIATDAVAKRGRFTMALSGGSTPKNLYTLIAANASAALPWAQMFFFLGDERHVRRTIRTATTGWRKKRFCRRSPFRLATSFQSCRESGCGGGCGRLRADRAKFFALRPGEFPALI